MRPSAASLAVREFHETFDIPKAHPSDIQSVAFRMRLISEEYREVLAAAREMPAGKEHFLKELCDLAYVIYGTAEAFGWNLDEAIERIHLSNMSKLDAEGKPIHREDGKVMKGPNYKEPYLGDLV
jgi:predicted HAD superfamily Cof-like phosphohydrolase